MKSKAKKIILRIFLVLFILIVLVGVVFVGANIIIRDNRESALNKVENFLDSETTSLSFTFLEKFSISQTSHTRVETPKDLLDAKEPRELIFNKVTELTKAKKFEELLLLGEKLAKYSVDLGYSVFADYGMVDIVFDEDDFNALADFIEKNATSSEENGYAMNYYYKDYKCLVGSSIMVYSKDGSYTCYYPHYTWRSNSYKTNDAIIVGNEFDDDNFISGKMKKGSYSPSGSNGPNTYGPGAQEAIDWLYDTGELS